MQLEDFYCSVTMLRELGLMKICEEFAQLCLKMTSRMVKKKDIYILFQYPLCSNYGNRYEFYLISITVWVAYFLSIVYSFCLFQITISVLMIKSCQSLFKPCVYKFVLRSVDCIRTTYKYHVSQNKGISLAAFGKEFGTVSSTKWAESYPKKQFQSYRLSYVTHTCILLSHYFE